MTCKVFIEKQRFRQRWVWLAVTGSAIPLYLLASALFFPGFAISGFIEKTVLVLVILHLLVTLLLAIIKLEVEITSRYVSYQLKPFHLQKKKIPLNQIQQAEVREYNPFRELTFMGIKLGRGTKSYCLNGFWGVQLELYSGKLLLLGTRRPDELKEVMQKLGIPGY